MSDSADQPQTLLAWLDDSQSAPEQNEVARKQFSDLNSQFRMLTSEDDFKKYLESQPTNARIHLIISGKLGEKLVPVLHKSPKIIVIYVYCQNRDHHKEWAKDFSKVNDVFVDFNTLKKALAPSQPKKNHSIISEIPKDDIPYEEEEVTRTGGIQVQPNYELDSCYMISDAGFDCIARRKTVPTDKDDFMAFCQEAFKESPELATIIQAIQVEYSTNEVIAWLFAHELFFRLIKNIFQASYVEGMFACRVLIHDVLQKLEKNKCPTTMHVYTGLSMIKEQIEQLRNQKGKIIAMKEFCSATTNRDVALAVANGNLPSDHLKGVLFDIEANPQTERVKPFALMNALISDGDPDQVLFAIGSLFEIVEILDEQDGIITIKMTLCAPDPENKTQALFDESKNRYLDSNGEIDTFRFGQLLVNLGRSLRDTAMLTNGEKIIRTHLDTLPQNHADYLIFYDILGQIAFEEQKFDESLDCYKKSLDIRKSIFQEGDYNLAENYNSLAKIYLHKEEYTLALEHFKYLSIIIKQSCGDEHISLINCYCELASIHELEERLPEAVSYYYKILSIMEMHSSTPSETYAAVYNNLGNINIRLERYELALGFYNASLKIKLASSTSNPQCTALTYKNIGIVHEHMDNMKEARDNYEKAAEIYRTCYPSDDPCMISIQELIASLPAES